MKRRVNRFVAGTCAASLALGLSANAALSAFHQPQFSNPQSAGEAAPASSFERPDSFSLAEPPTGPEVSETVEADQPVPAESASMRPALKRSRGSVAMPPTTPASSSSSSSENEERTPIASIDEEDEEEEGASADQDEEDQPDPAVEDDASEGDAISVIEHPQLLYGPPEIFDDPGWGIVQTLYGPPPIIFPGDEESDPAVIDEPTQDLYGPPPADDPVVDEGDDDDARLAAGSTDTSSASKGKKS